MPLAPVRDTPIQLDVSAGFLSARLWLDGQCIAEFESIHDAWIARGKALEAAHEGLAMLAAVLAAAPGCGGR